MVDLATAGTDFAADSFEFVVLVVMNPTFAVAKTLELVIRVATTVSILETVLNSASGIVVGVLAYRMSLRVLVDLVDATVAMLTVLDMDILVVLTIVVAATVN